LLYLYETCLISDKSNTVKIPLKIPINNYTLESFLEYILNNVDKVFDQKGERKWLKAYLIYVVKDWEKLFDGLRLVYLGDIIHIRFESNSNLESKDDLTDYYFYQWEPGLLLIFTSSTQESYENTLKQFILSHRGISQSWIRPSLLENIKNFLVTNHNAKVYRFIGRRYRYWRYPSKIRPEFDRRHSYSGVDAEETLKEMQVLYGISNNASAI
jgi:hypothetical protein